MQMFWAREATKLTSVSNITKMVNEVKERRVAKWFCRELVEIGLDKWTQDVKCLVKANRKKNHFAAQYGSTV